MGDVALALHGTPANKRESESTDRCRKHAMRHLVLPLLIFACGCGAHRAEPVGGRRAFQVAQPKQGVAIAAACKCEVEIRETLVLEKNFEAHEFVCAPSGVSACCIKQGTAGHRPFDVAAWYQAHRGVNYDELDRGDEVLGDSVWVLAGQVVVLRDQYSTDAFCAKYNNGVLTMQTMFRSRH